MGKINRAPMKAAPIELHLARCLDARHFQAKCSYCVDTCPAKAIHIDNRKVTLDDSICTGCGICLAVCPMEVFTTRNWSERAILASIIDLKGNKAELFCAKHPQTESRTVGPEMLKTRVCLAAISPGLLFEAGLAKQIDIRVDACRDCFQARASAHIENSAALANSWLSAVGCKQHISLTTDTSQDDEFKHSKKWFRFGRAAEADEVRFNRRDFLAGFAREGSSLFAAFLGMTKANSDLRDAEKSSLSIAQPHIHQWREALSRAYPKEQSMQGKAVLWPHVEVSNACTGCAVCEKYCPTRALCFHAGDERLTMNFTPGLCSDCGLCALACPVDAVRRGYAPLELPFDEKAVFDEEVSLCTRCNVPTLKVRGELCYWCASQPPLETLLDYAKSFLFASDENPRRP